MTTIVLFPFLSPMELARFSGLNKSSQKLLLKFTNFEVLAKAWGIQLKPADVAET
jgi:hypothetical protein